MKRLVFFIVCFLFVSTNVFAQQSETFDVVTFTTPIGWHKHVDKDSIQLGIEDNANGTMCLVTIYKSLPGSNDSKANFEASWETFVEKMVTVSSTPQLQPAANENGWTAESGIAQYERNGRVGVVTLITVTGYAKLVNILAVSNTDAYQQNITDLLDSISLPNLAANNTPSLTPSSKPAPPSGKSTFKSTITKFDDGWIATEQSDWVTVSTGNTVVLIHHAQPDLRNVPDVYKGTAFVWDTIVAPRYSNLSNFWIRQHWWSDGHEAKNFAEADATENATGRQVHVALYRNGNGRRWIEFITPDRESFQNQFGAVYEREGTDWVKLSAMSYYNRFAVAASDLPGTWHSSNYAGINYYNAYTGNNLGTAFTSHTSEYIFRTNGKYTSIWKGVEGFSGDNRYDGQTFNGKYTVTDWEMALTNQFKGRTETNAIHFEAVKGGRILHLNRNSYDEPLMKVK